MQRGEGQRVPSLTKEEKKEQQQLIPPNVSTVQDKDIDKVLHGIEVENPTPDDIPEGVKDQIGGKPGQVHDIRGKPINQEDAARIQAAETDAGHDIGKGSLAARAQAAAAFNQRENIVPAKGGGVGIEGTRGVRVGHEAELVMNQKTAAGVQKQE